jgi:hypothetical protein
MDKSGKGNLCVDILQSISLSMDPPGCGRGVDGWLLQTRGVPSMTVKKKKAPKRKADIEAMDDTVLAICEQLAILEDDIDKYYAPALCQHHDAATREHLEIRQSLGMIGNMLRGD